MQKLGELLSHAGVKGTDKDTKTRAELLGELQRMSRVQTYEPAQEHRNTALKLLPAEFMELERCKKGDEFLLLFARLVHANPSLVTKQTVYGVSQLLHRLRDACIGSKRKSFNKVIPQILDLKNRVEKKDDGQAVISSVTNVTRLWLPEWERSSS